MFFSIVRGGRTELCVQSVFYAWRATGNVKYYNFAASGIKAIAKYMKSNVGYAPLINVTDATTSTSNQNDDLEVSEHEPTDRPILTISTVFLFR
jgi:hypothetical protein